MAEYDYEDDFEDDDDADEFLEMAMNVKIKCDMASIYAEATQTAEGEDLEYEQAQYEKWKSKIISEIVKIHDEFAQGFAIHQFAKLCKKANDLKSAKPFFEGVKDEFLREKILEDCPELSRM